MVYLKHCEYWLEVFPLTPQVQRLSSLVQMLSVLTVEVENGRITIPHGHVLQNFASVVWVWHKLAGLPLVTQLMNPSPPIVRSYDTLVMTLHWSEDRSWWRVVVLSLFNLGELDMWRALSTHISGSCHSSDVFSCSPVWDKPVPVVVGLVAEAMMVPVSVAILICGGSHLRHCGFNMSATVSCSMVSVDSLVVAK